MLKLREVNQEQSHRQEYQHPSETIIVVPPI
jgi:hypothetical protein